MDWWYRFEWQYHGSVHVHGIAIQKEAPSFQWESAKANPEQMDEIVHYLDSLVTTLNPGLNVQVPEHHPCQKRPEEIDDGLQDYIELINKLQRHTRCSTSYCLKVNKQTSQQSCRFGFLKELRDQTLVQFDKHGRPELITARNNPLNNPHNRLQLQGWRANVDFKPILTTYAALQYISKYASKAEPRSQAFSY